MSPAFSLRFSHVGLFCMDLDRMVHFYNRHMGFTITDRGHLPSGEICFLSRDPREHHQIALVAGRPANVPDLIVNQISFRVDGIDEIKAFYKTLPQDLVSDIQPVNHGNAWALYFRDPEGNRLEVFSDTDWYIDQPCREPLDLSASSDEIRLQTLRFCESQPGFEPVEAWRARIAEKIRADRH
jgi:catechol 2,3-dioxygenase